MDIRILYLLAIADFSHGIEFIFKAVIGQYNLRTVNSHWRKQCTDIQGERKRVWGLKLKVSTVDIRIKVIHSKVPSPELKTLEWWISGLMLNPLFFLILRLNNACSPLIFNLQINYPIRIKDIPFESFQLRSLNKPSLSSFGVEFLQASCFFNSFSVANTLSQIPH